MPAESARDHIHAVLAGWTRCKMESITNAPWASGDMNGWLLPYGASGKSDPVRYDGLQRLDPSALGHAVWAHCRYNDYAFPGNPTALNERFCVRHDPLHVLMGYSASARGEILVSTFTASASIDTFAPGWDFWKWIDDPPSALPQKWLVSAAGLEG